MKRLTGKDFQMFEPEAYYRLWLDHWGIDVLKYPYCKSDFDYTQNRDVPFCVFNFDIARKEDGQRVAMALITYKSVFSKVEFEVVVYL